MLKFQTEKTFSTAKLTSSLWNKIYADIKKAKWVVGCIKLSKYDPENVKLIDSEVDRILSLRGRKELVTPAKTTLGGLIKKEAVYKDIEIVSNMLDVNIVLKDFPIKESEEVL